MRKQRVEDEWKVCKRVKIGGKVKKKGGGGGAGK